jgi:hypothetical protein
VVRDERRTRTYFGNAYYHSVRKLLYGLQSQTLNIRIYKTVILSVAFYECETRRETYYNAYKEGCSGAS